MHRRTYLQVSAIAIGVTVAAFGSSAGGAPRLRQSIQCPIADELDAFLLESEKAYKLREHERSRALLGQVLDRTSSISCPRQRSQALHQLSLADSYASDYDSARVKLLEALELARSVGPDAELRIDLELGYALIKLNRRSEAADVLLRARELARSLGNTRLLQIAYDNLMYAVEEGPRKDALREEALKEARSSAGGRKLECNVVHQWSDALFMRGKYRQAFPLISQAIQCFKDTGDRNRLGRALVSLGRVYRAHGRLDQALLQYQQALEQQRGTEDREGVIQSLNAIAVTLSAMGRTDEGLERFNEALQLARSLKSSNITHFLLANVGGAYLEIGRFREAASLLEEALAATSTAYRPGRLTQLSTVYLRLGEPARALKLADEALAIAANAEGSENPLLATLPARARALIALKRFDDAAVDLRRALDELERLRLDTLPDDFLRRGFSEKHRELFAVTIALLEAQGRHQDAMETAERARARAFLDMLAARTFDTSSRPARGVDGLARASAPATFAEIQGVAAGLGSAIVSYWVDKHATYVWVVGEDGRLTSTRIDIPAVSLASAVRTASGHDSATDAGLLASGASMRHWRELHQLLIAPVERALPSRPGSRLTIVPDGPLFGLSFAALRDKRDRYLLETYDIHYVPAVRVLEHTPSRPRSGAAGALLVGDPGPLVHENGITRLPAIPWAGREVRTIGSVAKMPVTILRGEQASEHGVRRNLSGHHVLHFATHGIVRNDETLASYLALRPSGDASDADGLLTADEIYSLHLDADLVVLSGCRTALGPLSGEGVIGFTRAFLAAGASSVVATMWDVADRTSYEVMRGFYGARAKGTLTSRSLRQAQLALLRALREGRVRTADGPLPEDPRLWAAYVLVGQPGREP